MDQNKLKIKRVRIATRKWTPKEEITILEYLLSYIRNYNEHTMKQSASSFFEKMAYDLNFDQLTASQLRNKVRNMQQKYLKATEWQKNNAHLHTDSFVSEWLYKMCPHWNLLHDIFGSEASSLLPFQFSSQPSDSEPYVECKMEREIDHFLDESIMDGENSSELAQSSDSYQNGSAEVELKLSNNSFTTKSMFTPQCNLTETNTALDNFAENSGKYSSTLETKMKIEEQRFLNESIIKQEELKLAKEKFDFEKECRLKELEMKKSEMESSERIRILQLEKEERLERLKLELDFKVQMAKLNQVN